MRTLIRERFISFTIVLGIGFLLLVSLVMSAALAALGASMRNLLTWPAFVWQIVDLLVSFAVTTFLFAMIFKILPNVQIRWRDVWTGAGITAFLFTIGKYLIGFYLGTSAVASYYGAAGSAIVLLLWVYYSACILFFGAEFTKSYVQKYGCGILPDKRAIFRPGVPAGKVS
jgi:membrane protein